MIRKLKFVKEKIKEWNKVHSGNIFTKKREIENELEELNELIMKQGMFGSNFEQEKELHQKNSEILTREEIHW